MSTYTENLNQLTRQYNDAIRALEESYLNERTQGFRWNLATTHLKRQYSKKYQALAHEYEGKKLRLLNAYKQANPEWARRRTVWGWIIVIGLLLTVGSCIGQKPKEKASPSALAQQTEAWNARNIPIPHLQDASQYVSNPDNILTQETVNRMNETLQRIDKELDIESVVIVVNRIENDDPFRMAQDVGNDYGVGRQDRGLVIVVGYLDHSINMSPGKALEADLTDAECHRLEQQYVVPAMRAELPDSGMLYLTEALYSTLQKKELPQMSQLRSPDEDTDSALIGIYSMLLLGWGIVFFYQNRKYQWIALSGVIPLLSNPFYEVESYSGNGHFGGGGFGGTFGGGGGSFGGGSFGGGGATSRW